MKPEMYDNMYQTDRFHWWFRAKREIVIGLLVSRLSSLSGNEIIDFGCGCGTMLKALSPYGVVTGADFSPLAIDYCKKRFPENCGVLTSPFQLNHGGKPHMILLLP